MLNQEFINSFIKLVGDIDIADLEQAISEYTVHLHNKSLSKTTIATYLRHLRVFLRYLEKEKVISDIADKVILPKENKKLVTIYSDEQIKELFNAITIEPEWLRYRNSALIALMLDSGLRLEELTKISSKDYQEKNHLLLVHGKGSKERLVPVGKFTEYYIKNYLESAPHYLLERSESLFVTRSGEVLGRDTVKQLVSKLRKDLSYNFSCHKLRHNFATNYCLDQYGKYGKIDIYTLMVLLGHEDIQTTRRYLHLANQIIASKTNCSHLDLIYRGE